MTLEELRLGFALTAGAATFFAPCAYPLLPGYIAYFLGDGNADANSLSRAGVVGLVASAGVFVVYVGLVGIVATAGAAVLSNLSVLGLGVGGLLVVLGLLMGFDVGGRLSYTPQLPERRRSLGGYFAFGVIYAVAAAGCTAPLFVGVVLWSISHGPTAVLTTVAAYAAGMCLLLVGTTVLTALGRTAVLNSLAPRGDRLKQAAGALLVAAGIAQVYLYLFQFGGLELLGLA